MNYKEIVDRLTLLMESHQMISDTGYGQLSDIKVLDESGDGADYPYAFLVPGQHQRQQQMMMYNFNLVVMEMAKDQGEVLKVQSDMMAIIDDLLGAVKHTIYGNLDVELNVSVNVFRERFQDEVAGATAQLTFELPLPTRGGGSGSGGDIECDPTPFGADQLITTATVAAGTQVDYYETLERFIMNDLPAGDYYVIWQGAIQNLQTLPDSGEVRFRSGKAGQEGLYILPIDPTNGAINEWTYQTATLTSTGPGTPDKDFNWLMDFGQHNIPDAAPGGQVIGLMEGRLYKVAE